MYWMTVTAAGEPFAFESHVAGSLGDCGALLHYDPRYSNPSENLNGVNYRGTETNQSSTIDASVKVNDVPTHSTEAFYINAEYLVDSKKLKKVGDFLDSSNILLTKPLPVNEKYSPIFMLNKWVNTDHGFYPCGQCTHAVCQQLDNSSIIIQEVIFIIFVHNSR